MNLSTQLNPVKKRTGTLGLQQEISTKDSSHLLQNRLRYNNLQLQNKFCFTLTYFPIFFSSFHSYYLLNHFRFFHFILETTSTTTKHLTINLYYCAVSKGTLGVLGYPYYPYEVFRQLTGPHTNQQTPVGYQVRSEPIPSPLTREIEHIPMGYKYTIDIPLLTYSSYM